MKTKRIRIIAIGVLVVVALGLAAGISLANLAGSNFEIDTDANLRVDDGGGALDWANVDDTKKNDETSGQNDDSFGQGTKEDTEPPTVVDGSIPPNKSDLKTFGVYQEENASGKFLHLFWTRVQDPSGTTNMDFEFNQSTTDSANGVTPVRTAGDLLIVYELSKGGTVPELFLFTWLDGTEGIPCEASNSYPCWGDRTDLDAAGAAEGSINSSAIPDGESDGLGPLDPRTFGEASIDLSVIFDPNSCTSFGSAYLKSRSSDSFTAALKDFIAPQPVNITNCGTVIIRKVTDPSPDPTGTSFGFTSNLSTDPADATANDFDLLDGGVKTINNVLSDGPYWVTEDDPTPDGFDLYDIDCGASTQGATYDDSDVQGRTATFDIEVGQTIDCTFYNRGRGTIIVDKITDPAEDPQLFSFDLSHDSTVIDSFQLADVTAAYSKGDLLPGLYSVAETSVLADWDLEDSYCETTPGAKDIDPANITLGAGETVYCYFENTKRGTINIYKETQPANLADVFSFTDDIELPNSFALQDNGSPKTFSNVEPGTYHVWETDPSTDVFGFKLGEISCTDSVAVADGGTDSVWSLADLEATINLDPGEVVNCTFVNATGAIKVEKTAKNLGGSAGLADVVFQLKQGDTVWATGQTDAEGFVCFDRLVPGTSFDVLEFSAPAGYAKADPDFQSVEVTAGATCTDGGTPNTLYFENTPLSQIEVIFTSLVPGATQAVITCYDEDGTEITFDSGPDNEHETFTNLPPNSDSTKHYTCHINIDP